MDTQHIVSDLKGLKKENLISEIKTALNVALFKKDVMTHVANDAQKTKFGYYIIIVGAILGFLGMQLFGGWLRPTLVSGLISTVIQAVMTVVFIYVINFFAKACKGTATFDQFFRVAAYSMILNWASIIPAVGIITGIWGFILLLVILKTIHKLTTGGIVLTLIGTICAYIVVSMILGLVGFSILGGKSGIRSSLGSFSDKAGTIDFSNGGMKIKTDQGEVNFTIPNIK